MVDTFSSYFASGGFMPHGYCFLWAPSLLWVDVASDLITAASYFSIPFVLWYFVKKRADLPFRWIFVMFGVFVLACGTTHLFEAWNIWHTDYWAEAGAKAITAAVSAATAIMLWPLLPKALTIPSNLQLAHANRELQDEAMRREQAESALHAVNQVLERRVAERTAELERVNDSLRESEARFRGLTQMSSDFYWETDVEHRLTARGSAGNKPSTVSVFQRGAQLGERRWEIPHLSPDEAGWQGHRTVLDAHQPFRHFEFSRLGSDGTERFIAISGDPVFDASRVFRGYRGVGTDFTERKKAEEALKLFRALIDQSNDAIEVVDPDTFRFLDVNQKDCVDLGYSREEMLSLTVFDIDPTYDRSTRTKRVQDLKKTGSSIAESRHRRKDGSEFPVELSLRYVQLDRDYVLSIARDITARKQIEQALRASEEKFAKAFRSSPMFVSISTVAEGRYIDVNEGFLRGTGHTREEIIGHTSSEIALWKNPHDRQRAIDSLMKNNNRISGFEAELCKKSGESMTCEIWTEQIVIEDKPCVIWVTNDVTERKHAESQIQRLTQLYAALSQCNQAIVRCASEEELFQQICRAAVQLGGMKMAWIGTVDSDTRMVRVAASFGKDADAYLKDIEISTDTGSPLGQGPTGTAIRENQQVWSQDLENDPRAAPWQVRREGAGFRAWAALPLCRDGVPVGALNLYAAERDAFDEAARNLLAEMATDINFALDNFAHAAARERAEINLRAAEQQFRGLIEQSIAGTYIVQDGKFAYVNPRYAEIFGYASTDELIGRDFLSIVAEKDRAAAAENLRRRIEGEIDMINYEFTGLRKDGATVDIGVHGARATHAGRPAVVGLIQDISEKKRAEEQIQHYVEQLKIAFMSTVEVATTLSEMRDPYTAGHERHVGELAMAIGARLGLDERRQEGLRVAGYLHDIGKITIPAEILSKPGKLSPIEYELIKGHPQSGYDVLKDVEFPWPIAQVALQHHERMDGSGYPQGLKGEAILFEARIMAVADVMEAMSSHRPYRPGLGIEKALAEIERGRGTAYDPAVADACLQMFREGAYTLGT
jgi:PAS domain S-box-containing protein